MNHVVRTEVCPGCHFNCYQEEDDEWEWWTHDDVDCALWDSATPDGDDWERLLASWWRPSILRARLVGWLQRIVDALEASTDRPSRMDENEIRLAKAGVTIALVAVLVAMTATFAGMAGLVHIVAGWLS